MANRLWTGFTSIMGKTLKTSHSTEIEIESADKNSERDVHHLNNLGKTVKQCLTKMYNYIEVTIAILLHRS